MKLTDLDPELIWKINAQTGGHWTDCPDLAHAQAIWFQCPRCVDGHRILVPFENRGCPPPEQWCPGLPRWTLVGGSSIDDITIWPSILVSQPCGWHGFVRNGEIVNA